MRKELKNYRNNKGNFTAKVEKITNNKGIKRIMLSNISEIQGIEVDHMWFTVNVNGLLRGLKKGEIINFIGKSYLYTKKNNSVDYGLKIEKVLAKL